MLRFTGEKRWPEVEKRNNFLSTIPNEIVTDNHIKFSKWIHEEKTKTRNEFDIKHFGKLRNSGKHSNRHEEKDLFFGTLGEQIVAIKYGVHYKWIEEQKQQIEKIKNTGVFDISDVGKTQIRTGEYTPNKLMSIIVRDKDFNSKRGQPTIGCIYSKENRWMKICGWLGMNEIINNSDFGSPDDGDDAYFIPPYKLNSMLTFDKSFLL